MAEIHWGVKEVEDERDRLLNKWTRKKKRKEEKKEGAAAYPTSKWSLSATWAVKSDFLG